MKKILTSLYKYFYNIKKKENNVKIDNISIILHLDKKRNLVETILYFLLNEFPNEFNYKTDLISFILLILPCKKEIFIYIGSVHFIIIHSVYLKFKDNYDFENIFIHLYFGNALLKKINID